MLGFIIPFRQKSTSKNWPYHSALLKRTLISACAQTNDEFKVFVVFTDMPECEFAHPKITYVHYPYPFLNFNKIVIEEINKKQNENITYIENAMDQGRRTLYGARFAIEAGCTYIMSLDADDLVSNKLAYFVSKNSKGKPAGWYIDKGYVYVEGRSYVHRQPSGMSDINGSTNIVRKDLVPAPNFESHRISDFNFFAAHSWLKFRIFDLFKESLAKLPFYALIYVRNEVSWTFLSSNLEGNLFKKVIKLFWFGEPIKKSLKQEFNLYTIQIH
jgi:hypothetical protein